MTPTMTTYGDDDWYLDDLPVFRDEALPAPNNGEKKSFNIRYERDYIWMNGEQENVSYKWYHDEMFVCRLLLFVIEINWKGNEIPLIFCECFVLLSISISLSSSSSKG